MKTVKRVTDMVCSLGALLLNHHRLKSLDATPNSDHHSVFKWIWQNQPLDMGEYNWIFHPGDFVSMIPPRRNQFENSIERILHNFSNSPVKVRNCSFIVDSLIRFKVGTILTS
jgi:hypothetical protein